MNLGITVGRDSKNSIILDAYFTLVLTTAFPFCEHTSLLTCLIHLYPCTHLPHTLNKEVQANTALEMLYLLSSMIFLNRFSNFAACSSICCCSLSNDSNSFCRYRLLSQVCYLGENERSCHDIGEVKLLNFPLFSNCV